MQLFYDVEIFKHNSLIVIKDINKKLIRAMWDRFDGLIHLIHGNVIAGYNNYHYDDYILSRMLMGDRPEDLKKLNDKIIGNQQFSRYLHPCIDSLDVFQQIDISFPSLKKIEGNMGRRILESEIPFDLDRPLTDAEKDTVLEYCSYDVDNTIDIFKMRDSYFTSKRILVERLGNPKAQRWNTTTISANLLLKKPLPKWAGIRVPEAIMEMAPPQVREMWLDKSKNWDKKISSITVQEFNNSITFGFGGLHGEHQTRKRAENVILLDVTSMYPNIIILLDVLGAGTEIYREILAERVRIKYTNPYLSEALKTILNSVYGNLNNEHSLLYNPRALLSVVIYGQVALYELAKRLSPVATIININTDGVAFTCDNDAYLEIWHEWEKDFRLNLERKDYRHWIQKDVNNYIAVKEDGSLTVKGGDVKRYEKEYPFSNNSLRIIDRAIVNQLLNDKDPIDTLTESLKEPELFQYILQAGSTYKGTVDEQGREYQKVNRAFAIKRGGVILQKKRMDGGLVMYPDAPKNMLVWNEDISELDPEKFERMIDLNHYYRIIKKKLEEWVA